MPMISSPPVFTTGAIWMLSRRQNWWPKPARQIEAERLLPLLHVFKQLDDAQPVDEVLVDDSAVDREVAGDAEDRQRPQHPALDIVAGQQEQQARPGISRAALLDRLEQFRAHSIDGRQQAVVALCTERSWSAPRTPASSSGRFSQGVR